MAPSFHDSPCTRINLNILLFHGQAGPLLCEARGEGTAPTRRETPPVTVLSTLQPGTSQDIESQWVRITFKILKKGTLEILFPVEASMNNVMDDRNF